MQKDHIAEFNAIKNIERQIIRKLVEDALRDGLTVKHNDGEDDTATVSAAYVSKSDEAINALADMIMKEINATDEEYLIFYSGESKIGWVQLIYGNTGYDVIADHTDSKEMEHLLAGANALADELESKFNAEFNDA